MNDPNREQLTVAAQLLRPLLGELVFVGGCATGLLITDPGAGDPRSTLDVDAIAEITSYAEYVEFGARLRELGFAEDSSEDALLCRWVQDRTILDVMPLDEKILGFSNRWYRDAMTSSVTHKLADDLDIRILTAPFFIATKLDAFKGRGRGDLLLSPDLEDVITVVDGRASLLAEVRAEAADLQLYIRTEIGGLLAAAGFLNALPGYLLPDAASQARIAIVLERLKELASR
ncbi:MAG TPA: hypothetical protein VEU96_01945 [Bryobacteraceae bacterium]|nr:hypothetical protein [Bryobacteraceae bacterium]